MYNININVNLTPYTFLHNPSESILRVSYLIVDSCNDSCSNPHANDVGTVEILVEDQRLDRCCGEQQDSIHIAMPVWL